MMNGMDHTQVRRIVLGNNPAEGHAAQIIGAIAESDELNSGIFKKHLGIDEVNKFATLDVHCQSREQFSFSVSQDIKKLMEVCRGSCA
jgi:hypothetical protein